MKRAEAELTRYATPMLVGSNSLGWFTAASHSDAWATAQQLAADPFYGTPIHVRESRDARHA